MRYSRIGGTGSYLPERVLSNADLEKMVDTTDQWIVERTGISHRHILADDETTSTMSQAAAEKAIAAAGITVQDIDLIILGTSTPDRTFPSTACILQHRLGAKNCPAFDVSAACAGFIYGLSIADQFIKNGTAKNALVVGADALSRIVDWQDRSTCILFGDGAGAVVLQADEKPGILATHIEADGQYSDLLFAPNHIGELEGPAYINMQGSKVMRVAVKKLGAAVEDVLAKSELEQKDVDWLIPHQANLRIIKAAAKKLNLPMDKVILKVQNHGNTSAASVPLALDHGVREGKIKRGQNLILEAFGGGFTWGAALIKY